MKAFPIIACLALAGAVASTALAQGGAKDAPKGAPKATTVNGKPIPKARFDFMLKQQIAQGRPDNEQLRNAIRDQLVAWEMVQQEADRTGLTKNADVQTQIALSRQQIIFQAYVQDYVKTHPIKEEAIRAEYNRVKALRGEKEYKARHILVEKDTEAKDIIEQLKKGAKFEDLAKQSKDPGSKDKGGELDWQPATTYVKPFADALVKLEKGKTTEVPVQSQFGWHVIRLDDVRAAQFPEFDAVKQQIVQMLQGQEVDKMVKDMLAKAKVE
jgi:peptidyl-prolyl cis-trans isomerase C